MAQANIMTATIAASGTTSDLVDLGGNVLVAIETPDVLTGTSLTFKVSQETNPVPYDLKTANGAGARTVTVAPSQYVPTTLDEWRGVRYVQIISGSTETAERKIKLVTVNSSTLR